MADIAAIPLSNRRKLATLIDPHSARDALPAYYALQHPEDRVRLFGYEPAQGEPRGFLALAKTGLDLFRPLAVPFVGRREILIRLLRDALDAGQPFLINLPAEQLKWLDNDVDLQNVQVAELLRLEPGAYEPVLNVLVVEAESPDGTVRYEIRTATGLHAAAGVNWKGEEFAEVYLEASDAARGRGLTKSVLSAIVGRLLGERRLALYRVETERISVKTEAFRLGFRPTGHRTALAEAVLLAEAERESWAP